MMQQEVVIAGFGGQGIMFAGQLLAYAAMEAQREVTWIPSYGPEMRGGTAYCFVVVSETPIGSPIVRHPRMGLIFNLPSLEKFAPMLAENGYLLYNASLVPQGSERTDLQQLGVPAVEIAAEIGDKQLANMVMLGALLTANPFLTLANMQQALEAHLPAHRRDKLANNLKALEQGSQFTQQHLTPLR
jgi:2-oxoglutarate ferredoxin oxidoreductase subunit gamma